MLFRLLSKLSAFGQRQLALVHYYHLPNLERETEFRTDALLSVCVDTCCSTLAKWWRWFVMAFRAERKSRSRERPVKRWESVQGFQEIRLKKKKIWIQLELRLKKKRRPVKYNYGKVIEHKDDIIKNTEEDWLLAWALWNEFSAFDPSSAEEQWAATLHPGTRSRISSSDSSTSDTCFWLWGESKHNRSHTDRRRNMPKWELNPGPSCCEAINANQHVNNSQSILKATQKPPWQS